LLSPAYDALPSYKVDRLLDSRHQPGCRCPGDGEFQTAITITLTTTCLQWFNITEWRDRNAGLRPSTSSHASDRRGRRHSRRSYRSTHICRSGPVLVQVGVGIKFAFEKRGAFFSQTTVQRRALKLWPVHVTRVHGPCLRSVNTGSVCRPLNCNGRNIQDLLAGDACTSGITNFSQPIAKHH